MSVAHKWSEPPCLTPGKLAALIVELLERQILIDHPSRGHIINSRGLSGPKVGPDLVRVCLCVWYSVSAPGTPDTHAYHLVS